MMKLTMTKQTENITFLIIDGLDEAGILETDFLDSHKARINYEDQSVELTFGVMRIRFQQTEQNGTIQVNIIEIQIIREDKRKDARPVS
jgi:hypothetical protein